MRKYESSHEDDTIVLTYSKRSENGPYSYLSESFRNS